MPILQNRLLDEAQLIRFARNRGIGVSGVVSGDPGNFRARGWLDADDAVDPARPRFHPFRILQLLTIVDACKLPISASSSINRDGFASSIQRVVDHLPSLERIGELAARARRVANLTILLEPTYWPHVTSRTSWSSRATLEEHQELVAAHRTRAISFLEELDLDEWREEHQRLRLDAARLDPNGDLYMLLRLSPWSKRERIKGRISGGMWLRHMAEVLRRAFEEKAGVTWLEEDQDYGYWFPGARAEIYGSERPLDTGAASKPHVAFEFGLHTGSTVRWYLEGDTEYHATVTVLPGAATGGIELVNLRGAIASERGNAAMKLADALAHDRELRRFSIITFDTDVGANRKTIRRQAEAGDVIGYVAAHSPDFEFANFSLRELVEVAARVDEAHGFSAAPLRAHDWTGIASGREFEKRYTRVSERKPRSLKGEEWGEALAEYAVEFPNRDTGGRRPFLDTVEVAVRALGVSYEAHRDTYRIDPATFALIPREDSR